MNLPHRIAGPDPARSRLRTQVAVITDAISLLNERLADDHSPRPPTDLVVAWSDLVGQLALGPEPEVRACPACAAVCMRAATRCGYCFAVLPPANP